MATYYWCEPLIAIYYLCEPLMARKYLCGTNDNNVVSKMYSKKTKKTFIHKSPATASGPRLPEEGPEF